MRESFLHYVWKNQILDQDRLFINRDIKVEVVFPGYHNQNAGPDFLEAKIRIGDILWVGNVEIHLKSSDWYAHGHEEDEAYDNVILHVVHEDDIPVFDAQNKMLPTLNISRLIKKNVLKRYNGLIKNKSILKCQNKVKEIDPFLIFQYKYKLYFERLENKNDYFKKLLRKHKNDWEQVLYSQLLKYFGGSVNKDVFEDISHFLPFEIFRKYLHNVEQLEALLLGVGGLLPDKKINTPYFEKLKKEFDFLAHKHGLKKLKPGSLRFHRMRPPGFPTIRLAQFAMLYHKAGNFFDKFINLETPHEAYELMGVTASSFWDTHYHFEKSTKALKKKISQSFIDRLLINVLIPLKFAYLKNESNFEPEELVEFIEAIKPEKNRIVDIFTKIGINKYNALDTQAMVELYNGYCTKERCLECDIGHFLLKSVE